MFFFPFYSYPNLQWITSCLLHAHLSLLATQSPKLEDPEPTVVLSFRSLSHVWIFCNSMDCSLPGFSVHGISQASVLESVAVSFSRGSSWHRDQTHVSCIGRWILYHWDQLSIICGCRFPWCVYEDQLLLLLTAMVGAWKSQQKWLSSPSEGRICSSGWWGSRSPS